MKYLAALLLLLAPVSAAAQAKAGAYYVDDTAYGFRIKAPKDWQFFPPKPGEDQMLGLYQGGTFLVSPDDEPVPEQFFLVKFDRRPGPDGKKPRLRYKDVDEFMLDRLMGSKAWARVQDRELRLKDVGARERVYEGRSIRRGLPVGAYAAVYEVEDGLSIAICGNGPGERKWAKYETGYERIAKTFERVGMAAREVTVPDDGSPRAQKRRKLQDEANRTPGWRLLETENYFVITNTDDRAFVDELMERIEAIRAVFEADYPPAAARTAKARKEAEADAGEPSDEERSISQLVDPMQLSRTSVVRVCRDRETYLGYGAPEASGGYWSPRHEELVVYNKKAIQGEDATWETLSHEAFHQYIFYFYGSLSPHSWYNEGTGDYYGGHELKRKKFACAPRRIRKDTIKELLREDRTIPLKEFVRWSQPQYYGANSYGLQGYDCYGQGWSLVYFLRTGSKSRGWKSEWETILPTYLETLVDTADLDAAVDAAFAGVDWDEFEGAWKTFIAKSL